MPKQNIGGKVKASAVKHIPGIKSIFDVSEINVLDVYGSASTSAADIVIIAKQNI